MVKSFVHPFHKTPLVQDVNGDLISAAGSETDRFKGYDGCYDFSAANINIKEARDAYDDVYGRGETPRLSLAYMQKAWDDKVVPWRKTMLRDLAPLKGKRVLLLGNGTSYIEFYFLHLGATVVFTDLSLVAARRAQEVFRNSEFWDKHREHIEFHAVDAMHMPFPDQSFDVIYGTKFVGFLPDWQKFFLEISRVLKPNGVCRFTDDAYAPAWEAVKRTIVHPVKHKLLRKSMSSYTRVRTDSTFAFQPDSLSPYIAQCGFSKLAFHREYFFLRVAQLCWATALGWDPKRERFARPMFHVMRWLDGRLANLGWMQRNRLALIWGFDK